MQSESPFEADEMRNENHRQFSTEVVKQLEFYVYRLIDLRNGETFYVGKGKGNRIFEHSAGALTISV